MAGRHPAQYTRYASSNPSYPNAASMNNSNGNNNNNNSLGVPYPSSHSHQAHGNHSTQSGSSYNTTTPTMTSPYSTTSSPGYHSPNMQKYNTHNQQLNKYTLQPPRWIPPLCKTMPSLGYPGMYPQRPNQIEDVTTESNVRTGFIDRPAVSNEHTCAYDMVYSKLQDDQRVLEDLGSFAVDVLKRKRNAAKITGTSTFKPPMRSTLIESKKEQWMHELASGTQPLRKLAKNVPHGFKGEKLLETLAMRQVPLLRAAWYIKVVGLSEMSQRNANNNATSVSQAYQWTTVVVSHLRRQLSELSSAQSSNSTNAGSGRGYKGHPSTPGNYHDNASKPWATPENRERFEQRWSYSTKLTKWQYCEGLLDQRTFLKWTLDSLAQCNSFEAMWLLLTFVVQDYVDEYRRNRTLMKLLIETLIKAYGALIHQLGQLPNEGLLDIYRDIQRYIERLLQSLFLSTPDIFVIPKLYHQYRHLFDAIFGDESRKDAAVALPDVCHVMQKYWAMVKARNEVFCGTLEENQLRLDGNCKHIVQSESRAEFEETRRTQVNEDHIIRTLDCIGRNVDSGTGLMIDENGWMDLQGQTAASAANSIFGGVLSKDTSTVQQRVNIMCRWGTSGSRHGDWRSYLVGSILLHWRDQNSDRKAMLQDVLIQWLDTQMESEEDAAAAAGDMMVDMANDPKPAVVLLFDTLIRLHLFSYQKYLLRLIARGDLEPRRRHEPGTVRCLNYLASFPLLTPAPPYLINQRRVAIYGTRNGQINGVEDEVLAQLKRLAKRAVAVSGSEDDDDLSTLFGQKATSLTQPDSDDSLEAMDLSLTSCYDQDMARVMRGATRYTILNFTSEWLVPELKRFVVKSVPIGEDNWRVMTSPGSCLLNVRQYVAIIKMLECAKDYLGIIEVALWVLEKTNERSVYSFTIDTLRRHASIWKLVNNGKRVAEAVWAKHQSLQSRGIRERCLMMYMIQLVQEGYRITDDMRTQLQRDLHYKPKARQYSSRNDVPLATELSQFIQNPTASTVHSTIDSACSRYQNTSDWTISMFSTVFETLQQYGRQQQINTIAASSTGSQEHKEELYEFRKRICFMVDFVKGVADQSTLTGQLDDAVIQWLSQQCSPISATLLDDLHELHTWLPLFLALLVTRRLISIDMVLKHFVLPWLEVISREAQQRCESQWTETTAETQPLRQLCKNLIDLVRMLVVQDRPEPHGPWALRADEIFQLQVRRQPQLATNLDKLDYMFGLVRNSIAIVSNLPYSSLLIQDLLKLRTDLLQLDWFRRACTRDVNSIYHHFATQHSPSGGEGEIRKKMLSIVDELIGGNMNIDRECQDSMVPNDLLEPGFGQRLQAVFANLSQWNEEQCRVQLNLLLDNIMINQHSGSTTITSTSAAPGAQDATNDAMVIDTSPAPTAVAAAGAGAAATSDAGNVEPNKELDLFVKFFFDAVLASASDTDSQQQNTQRRFDFLINLIHGLREPIILALLNHGVRMLEGNSSEEAPATVFPYTILLTTSDSNGAVCEQQTSSAHYGQRCQAFYLVMQHLLAKDVWSNTKKIELVQTLFRQVEQFRAAMNVYKIMESVHHVSFADASRALQQAKNVEVAVTLLKTEGLPESEAASSSNTPGVMLQDIRISLLLRLRLMVPFVSLIWEHPKEDECDILEWIKILVPLLGNPIVHGNGSQERMFEFVLDLVSLLIDEVPRELRKTNLSHLSAMHNELSGVPSMLHCRVKRILPFLTHNIYLSNTRLASSLLGVANATDPQQQQQHLEASMDQSKPWEWLEDYASEQPHDNDTPISFSLFHGRKAKKTENTYVRWYHFGFGDNLPSIADEDDDSVAVHVGMVGHRPSKRRRNPRSDEPGQQQQQQQSAENGMLYIVDDDQQQKPLQPPPQPSLSLQRPQSQPVLQPSSSSQQQQQPISAERRQDMEDGELP